MKHTPGPWKCERGERFHSHLWVVTAAGMAADTPLAMLQDFDDAAEPDARLIAAAPELLAALKNLTDNIEHAWPSLMHLGPLVDARAAIAKAEAPSQDAA